MVAFPGACHPPQDALDLRLAEPCGSSGEKSQLRCGFVFPTSISSGEEADTQTRSRRRELTRSALISS